MDYSLSEKKAQNTKAPPHYKYIMEKAKNLTTSFIKTNGSRSTEPRSIKKNIVIKVNRLTSIYHC